MVDADGPPMRFTTRKYTVNPVMWLYPSPPSPDEAWEVDNPPSAHDYSFGRVTMETRAPPSSTVLFKVEGLPDRATYERCKLDSRREPPWRRKEDGLPKVGKICSPMEIGVHDRSGLLRPFTSLGYSGRKLHFFNDFPTQRVELSATDSAYKVYREILVEPPEGVPDCSDYPERNIDRYNCLFQGEIFPSALPSTASEALRNTLPSQLVQPRENYEVVFVEEFDGNSGKRPSSNCRGGLANLGTDAWNFPNHWCDRVDSDGVPVADMENGYYYLARTVNHGGFLSTFGKLAYKYGYLEMKYTLDPVIIDENEAHVMAAVIGHPGNWMSELNRKYGVPVRNYEELSRHWITEIDFFEYWPEQQREIHPRFMNYPNHAFYEETKPVVAGANWAAYCRPEPQPISKQIDFLSEEECMERGNRVTVTKGHEWTPRGYRMFYKVDGANDDFIVVPKRHLGVSIGGVNKRWPDGKVKGFRYPSQKVRGSQRERYFEFTDGTNPDSILGQSAIAHMPLDISLLAWVKGDSLRTERILTKMKIDYIRLFQPRNRYADMEPVYQ